jgi:hypothetical protein
MLRTLQIALCSATMMVAACKKSDKPAPAAPETTKSADPAKPGDPMAPATAKPADPAASATAGSATAMATGTMAKPAEPAPVPTGTNSALETKGIAMMQKLADVFAIDGKNCDQLATDIKDFIAKNKPLLSELTAMEKKQSPQDREAFATRNKGVEESVMQKMTPAMTACRDNKNVEAAMKEFPTD